MPLRQYLVIETDVINKRKYKESIFATLLLSVHILRGECNNDNLAIYYKVC